MSIVNLGNEYSLLTKIIRHNIIIYDLVVVYKQVVLDNENIIVSPAKSYVIITS